MTLDEYLEALYDACFEEYCIENNIVTLLDPLEYFEERTSERKQRVQQQRKDAKKLAKTPIDQRPNPNAGAKTYADKVEEGKRKFLDRAHYDPKTKTIEIMGNKFEIDLNDDSGAACVFDPKTGKRYLRLDNNFYLAPPKHQDAILLHELAHKRLGHGAKSRYDIDLSKTNDRQIAEILRKNGIKSKDLHGTGVHEVEADAAAVNIVGERARNASLRNSMLHGLSNRSLKRDISQSKSEIGELTDQEKKYVKRFTDSIMWRAENEINVQIQKLINDDKEKDTKPLKKAIGDFSNPIYRKALVDVFWTAEYDIVKNIRDIKYRDRLEKILGTCPIATKIRHFMKQDGRKYNKAEADLRARIQQLPEIQELRKSDERYHTPDRTKGEPKGEYEDFIDRYIDARPNMKKYQDASKQAASDYSRYREFGSVSSIIKKYTDMGVDIDKAFPEKIDMNNYMEIYHAKTDFMKNHEMSDDEMNKYLSLFNDLYSRAMLRSRIHDRIGDAKRLKSGVDTDVRKAYDIKDSASKLYKDLKEESVLLEDDLPEDLTDEELEQCMIEMYEDAIRYNTISAMIDRMYDLQYK